MSGLLGFQASVSLFPSLLLSQQMREQAAVYIVGDAKVPPWGCVELVWISRTGSSRWDSSVSGLLLGWYMVMVRTTCFLLFEGLALSSMSAWEVWVQQWGGCSRLREVRAQKPK